MNLRKNLRKKKDIDWVVYSEPRFEVIEYPETPKINERTLDIKDEYCSYFGCGRKLNLVEKLCGKKCIGHMEIDSGL